MVEAVRRLADAGEGAAVIVNSRSNERVTEAIRKVRQKHLHAKLEPLIVSIRIQLIHMQR